MPKKRDLSKFERTSQPALLQQGFSPPAIALAGNISNQEYVAKSDRGVLKSYDIIPAFNLPVSTSADIRVGLSVGGVSLLEQDTLGMWAIQAQYGKNEDWLLKGISQQSQTIQFALNNNSAVVVQGATLIATYTTREHEDFIKNYLKLGTQIGLKRKTYIVTIPNAAAAGDFSITEILPRNQGNIIGIGISNSSDFDLYQSILANQLIEVSINGINIVEGMPAVYYNTISGRDNYFQPIFIQKGSTFTFKINQPVIAVAEFLNSLTFYFDN